MQDRELLRLNTWRNPHKIQENSRATAQQKERASTSARTIAVWLAQWLIDRFAKNTFGVSVETLATLGIKASFLSGGAAIWEEMSEDGECPLTRRTFTVGAWN